MKIIINKLFGKYYNEINLDKDLNIFIGENGIGKSTSIKILNKLFMNDYIGLLDYYFDNIEIIDDCEKITIKYSDLALSVESLVEDYVGKENFSVYNKLEYDFELIQQQDSSIDQYNYEYLIKDKNRPLYNEMIEREIDFQVVYDIKLFLSKIDNHLLYKILKGNNQILRNEKIIKAFESNGLSLHVIDFIRKKYAEMASKGDYYFNDFIMEDINIYFTKCEIGKKHKDIKRILNSIGYKDVFFIDMVSSFNITNNLNRIYAENLIELSDKSKPVSSLLENIFGDISFIDKYKDNDYCNKLKENYIVLKTEMYNWQKDLSNLDLGHILFQNIYTDYKIEEFQKDLYNFSNDYANSENKQKYNISDKTYNKIRLYLRPLLSEGNPIGRIMDSIFVLDNNTKYLNTVELNFLGAFYDKFKDKYFDINDEKLDLLNSLLKKYFTNKEVIATPFGISISTKDYENDIDFEELSAGEKKIIILFILLTFSKNYIILLDEPEASLSVVWQKDLIKDIVTNFNYRKLIVVTQSPYIISCDEFIEDLVCLPLENNNE